MSAADAPGGLAQLLDVVEIDAHRRELCELDSIDAKKPVAQGGLAQRLVDDVGALGADNVDFKKGLLPITDH